jgi:cytochrome c553
MKTALKILGGIFAALILLLTVAFGGITVASRAKLKKTFVVDAAPVAVPADAAAIAQGEHLATTRGCRECHGSNLAGATVFDNGAMGRVDAPNLTRGAGGLPATWRDLDYVRAIRHGVAPDGRGLFLMPSADYATFSADDMGDLIAYLKSLPPVDKPSRPIALGPVARALVTFGKIKLDAERINHATVKPATVAVAATPEYGRYLANGCTGCHGSNFSGGRIAIGPPDWPPAANLTPDAAGRLTKWTETDFMHALRTARRPDGTEINPVMPRVFAQFNDVEAKALWAFLKTLPAAPTGSHD